MDRRISPELYRKSNFTVSSLHSGFIQRSIQRSLNYSSGYGPAENVLKKMALVTSVETNFIVHFMGEGIVLTFVEEQFAKCFSKGVDNWKCN